VLRHEVHAVVYGLSAGEQFVARLHNSFISYYFCLFILLCMQLTVG
jgi:hypothetical protein